MCSSVTVRYWADKAVYYCLEQHKYMLKCKMLRMYLLVLVGITRLAISQSVFPHVILLFPCLPVITTVGTCLSLVW